MVPNEVIWHQGKQIVRVNIDLHFHLISQISVTHTNSFVVGIQTNRKHDRNDQSPNDPRRAKVNPQLIPVCRCLTWL